MDAEQLASKCAAGERNFRYVDMSRADLHSDPCGLPWRPDPVP
jgi:hypothetical protein